MTLAWGAKSRRGIFVWSYVRRCAAEPDSDHSAVQSKTLPTKTRQERLSCLLIGQGRTNCLFAFMPWSGTGRVRGADHAGPTTEQVVARNGTGHCFEIQCLLSRLSEKGTALPTLAVQRARPACLMIRAASPRLVTVARLGLVCRIYLSTAGHTDLDLWPVRLTRLHLHRDRTRRFHICTRAIFDCPRPYCICTGTGTRQHWARPLPYPHICTGT